MSTLDEWINSSSKKKTVKPEVSTENNYKLPTGAVAVYFKEGEGYTFHYDAREYNGREEALLTNLGVVLQIWNKLIKMNYSPRYLSKAYDDDIYAIVLTNVEKETDEMTEINGLRVHISKHPLDAKIRDLSEWTPKIPDEIEKKFDRNIDFENPMLKYQELKSKSQEESEKPVEQETISKEECTRYTVEYIKQLLENDPYIYDPRFQRIWYTDEITYAFQHNNWHTNSEHFNMVMRTFTKCWKENGNDIWDFNEQIGDIIHQYKDKHLKQLMKYWEKDLKKHIDNTKEFAKSRNIEYTEIWRQHSLQTWRDLNLIREELHLHLLPIPEILNYSTQEIINKVLSEGNNENELDKYTEPTKNSNQSEKSKEEQSEKEYVCEICGRRTDKLYQLKNGQLYELLPDKKVCWDCYVSEHRKLYEKYGKCPECGAKIHLREWPDFECENGHIINVNSIEIDTKKLLDDTYGKLAPEEYKKLHDKLYTIKDAIEEKYNKPVHSVHLTIVNKSLTGITYDPVAYYSLESLKDEIEKIKTENKIFAGLSVIFKDDTTETWMDENFTEIEKPEIIKKAEKNLKKATQDRNNNSEEDSSNIPHTPLTEWTKEGDSNV